MKHNWKITSMLMLWTLVTALLGMAATQMAYQQSILDVPSVSGLALAGIIVLIVLASAAIWYVLLQKMKERTVELVFSAVMAMVLARVVHTIIPISYVVRGVLLVMFGTGIFVMMKIMQGSERWTMWLAPVSNALMVITIAFSAAIVAVEIPPWTALLVLFCIALYDMWAVWKSKSMVFMANYFIKRRAFPGILIVKPGKKAIAKRVAVLGGGDLFFIVFVAAAFYKYGAIWMVGSILGMVFGLFALLLISNPKRMYPALPAIFLGAVAGIGLLVFLAMASVIYFTGGVV